jgi:hypothetical protein
VSERPPLVTRRPAIGGNGRDANPWLELARRQGYKPPVDVEQRLAAMQYQGSGDAAIHPTQLTEHPGLYYKHVEWDSPGKVALANGALDLHTREFTAWSPKHFLRRKLGVPYDPEAAAPQFSAFLLRLLARSAFGCCTANSAARSS